MAKREEYNAQVIWSTKPLSKIEQIMFSQSPDALPLDQLTADSAVFIDTDYAVIVAVHNEKNKGDKDYENTYVVDRDGSIYKTSSQSFTTNLQDTYELLEEDINNGDRFPVIKVFQKMSKTRAGQHFITCSVHSGPIPTTEAPIPTPETGDPVENA